MTHDYEELRREMFALVMWATLPTASMEASRRWYDLYHVARGGEQA